MTSRHTLTLLLLSLGLGLGCNLSHQDADAGPMTDGEPDGVCCPITDWGGGCSPGAVQPGGGWAPSADACSYTIDGYDIYFERQVESHGCPMYVELPSECCGCVPVDAGPADSAIGPLPCAGLGEVACLEAGCLPTYHDACCSSCEPGTGCADCADPEFWECHAAAEVCGVTECYQASEWGCGGAEPDCSDASPTGLGSCSLPGCAPVVAAEGSMEPVERCVPVTAESCSVACRALPPTCPTGTTAEADGFCWTGNCIPASVCAP